MQFVLVAAGAVLLPLDALRMETLVLAGEVVPALTVAASENDLVSGHSNVRVKGRALELAIGIEPMTSPLPRVCSTN
jgi:hypothetical protein